MMEKTGVPHVHEDEDDVDGCICDVEYDESEAVSDMDLPPAAGGVQAAVEERGDEDAIDGCDVDFDDKDVTADEELPIASGGVLEVKPPGGV